VSTARTLVAVAASVALALGCASNVGGDAPTAGPSASGPARAQPSSSAPSGSTNPPGSTAVASRPIVIAHRGASGYAPEHTFAAYDLAIEQGADYLEQDLQLTADGVLVVLHDATLDRTARGPAGSCTGPVAEKTLAQIEECEVGSWFNEAHPDRADPAYVGLRIPTMQQVIDRYGDRARYYIELKALGAGSGMEAPLLDLLANAGLLDANAGRPVIVQSFGADVLRTVHASRPELPLVQLLPDTGSPIDVATLDRALEYATAVGPASAGVDQGVVTAAHARCLDVHPYTVDDPDEMARLLDAGVDGLFTNRPDVLRAAVAGRPGRSDRCAPRRA
jgi:glycerophosphoryl diester phosphodiesterase